MNAKKYFVYGFGILFLLLFLWKAPVIIYNLMSEEVTVTVMGRDRVPLKDGDVTTSRYVVFTKGEVFENTDTWIRMKWNSSDLQGQLLPGQTYKVKVIGYRMAFFSTYRNIVDVVPSEHNGTNSLIQESVIQPSVVASDTLINGKRYQRL